MSKSSSSVFALSLFALLSCTAAGTQAPPPAQDPGLALTARRKVLHDAGVAAPMTVHPVRVLGKPNAQVAEALGLVLEQRGMPDLEVAATPFELRGETAWDDVPALFAAHVRQSAKADGAARHHLYAEFLGTPRTGPDEVRFVVVDAMGELVLSDRQTRTDADFQATAAKDPDPLGCATLVGTRLFSLAEWRKAPPVRDGKFGKRWREKSGVPDAKELAAMQQRLATLRSDWKKARLVVWPTLAAGKHDADSSARLAQLLRDELGGTANAADGARLEVAQSSNQQKRLWDLARGVRAAVTKQPVDADYVLVVDQGLDVSRGAGFVNVVLCTANGELVLVDFQNDQHPLFQQAAPKTLADCERLAVARLRELLR